jgi:outer membrane protein OmpA-like peptidoglycan-associated protein
VGLLFHILTFNVHQEGIFMRRLAIVSALFLLSTTFFAMDLRQSRASTMVPVESDPGACQATRKNREKKCAEWFTLTQRENPDACLFSRPDRERCWRWYAVEEEKPRPPKIEAKKIVIDQKIHFDFDKSVIKKESYGILDDVASILKSHPQIKKVRVEGHTDSIGSDAYNQKLSERRANSVRDYLISKGIDGSRLEAVGYGESRPIADNKTAEGRAQNRRTEFNVVEQ